MNGIDTLTSPAVLIIGNGGSLGRQLQRRLRSAGCDVSTAKDGKQGIERAVEFEPDIIMLDGDLPDSDCLEVCRLIRQYLGTKRSPVFLVTPHELEGPSPHGEAESAVDEFDADRSQLEGGLQALVAWLETAQPADQQFSGDGLEMDRRRHLCRIDGRPVKLTATEFRILWVLAVGAGEVFDRHRLCQFGLGRGAAGNARTVDVHIRSIRSKLGDRASLVETVHGVGYRLHTKASTVTPS